jgi:hypothetical protein
MAPKIYKTILHQASQTIYKSPNHFYIFFSLLYICIENPILQFAISMSFHLQIDGLGAQIFPRNWIVFPKCGKTESCWRAVFSILPKKSRLGVGFENSWRCSYDDPMVYTFITLFIPNYKLLFT